MITGSYGFLGRFLRHEFSDCDVTTLGLNPNNDIVCDLSLHSPQFSHSFDLVVHAAGDIHPKKSNSVNFTGTINLCNSLDPNPPKQFVFISSVQVYGKVLGENLDESTPLRPITSYGKSKHDAETYLIEWCKTHNVTLTILRPPLILGTGMKGTLRSMVNGIYRGYYHHIKGNQARRSIIHAIDVAKVVKLIAPIGGTYNITDGVNPSVYDLAEALSYRIGDKRIYTISMKFAKFLAKIGDIINCDKFPLTSKKLTQLTESLTFNGDAIKNVIDWTPNNITNYLRNHNYDEDSL